MNLSKLPAGIEARRWIEQGLSLHGQMPLDQLERLSELLLDKSGDVSLELQGSRDRQGHGLLSGRVQTCLQLECQRCLTAVALPVDSSFILMPMTPAQEAKLAAELPDEYEPLLIDEQGMVDLQQLIEDELLLALPSIVRHESEDCQVTTQFGQLSAEAEQQLEQKKNPFAVLKSLT